MKLRSSKRLADLAIHSTPGEAATDHGAIHLWLFDLDDPGNRIGAETVVSAEELRRSVRLKDPQSRRRSLTKSAMVRRVLGGVLAMEPEGIAFVEGVCGKPRAVPGAFPAQQEEVNFNISHSENILAIALTYGPEVGVDVEVADRRKGDLSLYRKWTRLEAAAKLAGTGIASRESGQVQPDSTRCLELRCAGRQVVVAVATGEASVLHDPSRGVTFWHRKRA